MRKNRRKFLKQTGWLSVGVSGLSLLPINPAKAKAEKVLVAPNERIGVGLIGAGGMGYFMLTQALAQPEIECVALCDIDENILDKRETEIQEYQSKKPKRYNDFRKLLENKDIDAVIIATPDHWHCLPMIYACEAGKDVYIEKPLANSIGELEPMVRAARKYNRVVQVGQQQRSGKHWHDVMATIKSGKIGQLRKVQVWANFEYGIGRPKVNDSPVPRGVDFDMWLGPAPERTFNASRFHGSWRMFWDYGGGLLTDWGVHLIDMALWAKDVDYLPLSVSATGGNFAYPDHAHETFDTMTVNWQMKDFDITWENIAGINSGPYSRNYGLAYVGNDATLIVNRQGWEVVPEVKEGEHKVPLISQQEGGNYHKEHFKNFVDCIKSRRDPECSIEMGQRVATYAHMGNIALRTKSMLKWDTDRQNFGENLAANSLITPQYRKPWALPKL